MDKEILDLAKREIDILKINISEGRHIRTIDIRKLSSKLFKLLPDKSINTVLTICETFLKEHSWELGIIAYDWANKVNKDYTLDTYDVFYCWLKKYVRGWGDCDDFCTHAFGQLLIKHNEIFSNILNWTEDDDFWVRRASAVILIPAISKNNYDNINPFEIVNRLLDDKNDLVRKGYGWMLKVLSTVDEESVIKYLEENHTSIPRVSFRYAIEKINIEKRNYLMKL